MFTITKSKTKSREWNLKNRKIKNLYRAFYEVMTLNNILSLYPFGYPPTIRDNQTVTNIFYHSIWLVYVGIVVGQNYLGLYKMGMVNSNQSFLINIGNIIVFLVGVVLVVLNTPSGYIHRQKMWKVFQNFDEIDRWVGMVKKCTVKLLRTVTPLYRLYITIQRTFTELIFFSKFNIIA